MFRDFGKSKAKKKAFDQFINDHAEALHAELFKLNTEEERRAFLTGSVFAMEWQIKLKNILNQ